MVDKVPSYCDFCYTKLGPTERYIKYRRPDGIRFMCLGCYRKNGSNPKHVRTRMKGGVDIKLVPRKKSDIYNDKLKEQNGVCAICGKSSKENRRLNLDHDHETGRFRGLLCTRCNLILGVIENNEIQKAIDYIEKWDKIYQEELEKMNKEEIVYAKDIGYVEVI